MMGQAGRAVDAAQIQAAARLWIGTPYQHQASRVGVGADCLGLLRGVWREVIGQEVVKFPNYTADWTDTGGREALIGGLGDVLSHIEVDCAGPGDVVAFRMAAHGPAKHVGILAAGSEGQNTFIHSYSRYGVVESAYTAPWQRRAAAFFRFPGRSN